MNPTTSNKKFFIVNIDENKGTFSIEETDQKPKSHHLALETLKNMEKVIQNTLKYDSQNDKYPKLDRSEVINLFKSKAAAIEKKYMQAASDCNWLSRLLFSEEKKVQGAKQKIDELSTSPISRDAIGEISKYLTPSELAALRGASNYLKTNTESALIHSVQEFGYTGKDHKEAGEYMKNLFIQLDSLIIKKKIPLEWIVKTEKKEGFVGKITQVIDREATLTKLKNLSNENILTLVNENSYRKPAGKVFRNFLLMNYKKGNLNQQELQNLEGPLISSLKQGADDVLKCLIKNGVDPVGLKFEGGDTLLHFFAGHRGGYFTEDTCLEAIEILLAHGADPNVQNEALETPLHVILKTVPAWSSYFESKLNIVEHLLAKGADPFIADKDGIFSFQHALRSPLNEYAQPSVYNRCLLRSSLNILKLLFADKEKINRQTPAGHTVLHFIFSDLEGKLLNWQDEDLTYPAIHYFLKQGANITIKNNDGETPSDYLKKLTPTPRTIIEFYIRKQNELNK